VHVTLHVRSTSMRCTCGALVVHSRCTCGARAVHLTLQARCTCGVPMRTCGAPHAPLRGWAPPWLMDAGRARSLGRDVLHPPIAEMPYSWIKSKPFATFRGSFESASIWLSSNLRIVESGFGWTKIWDILVLEKCIVQNIRWPI